MVLINGQDTYIYNLVNSSHGSELYCNAYYYPDPVTPSLQRILLSFDVSAYTVNTIDLFLYNQNGSTDTIYVHKLNRDFLENEATWTNATTVIPWTSPGAEGDYDPAPLASYSFTDIGWGMIPIPISAVNGGKLNLLIKTSETGSISRLVRITSKEAGINSPYIDVNATPRTGTLDISSNPVGAKIVIDTVDSGYVTPASLQLLVGTHVTRLTLPGYIDYVDNNVIIQENTVTQKSYTMQPVPTTGELSIQSNPPGASIFIDGSDTFQITPFLFTFSPGTYSVTLKKTGYEDYIDSAAVTAGITTYKTYSLVPLNIGSLDISSEPAGAAILIDTIDTGYITPALITGIAAGDHSLRLTYSNLSYNQDIHIDAGKTTIITAALVSMVRQTVKNSTGSITPIFAEIIGVTLGLIVTMKKDGK